MPVPFFPIYGQEDSLDCGLSPLGTSVQILVQILATSNRVLFLILLSNLFEAKIDFLCPRKRVSLHVIRLIKEINTMNIN